MCRIGAVQGVEHAEVVNVLGNVGEQRADRKTALAVLAELPRRGEELRRLAKLNTRLFEWQLFAVLLFAEGFLFLLNRSDFLKSPKDASGTA